MTTWVWGSARDMLLIGDEIKLVTTTGWDAKVSYQGADANGLTVRMKQGQMRYYPWTSVRCICWGGPPADESPGGQS